jgi:hypothetical protein
MDQVDAEVLARKIVPGLIEEYGRHASQEMTACWIADYLLEHGIDLNSGEAGLLYDEVRDLAKTS